MCETDNIDVQCYTSTEISIYFAKSRGCRA